MNFFEQLYKIQELPTCYTTIGFNQNREILDFKNRPSVSATKFSVGSFMLVPNYLDYLLHPDFLLKNIEQTNLGYAVDLQDHENAKEYVRSQFKKDTKNILKRNDRLARCFSINFKVYGKEITEEEYEFLMGYLKKLLVDRFDQRNDINKNLSNWSLLYSALYQDLLVGKALVFVIYDDLKPIQITVTYRLQHVLFSAIPAYDIDYSKFGLGNTAIFKQIEWCLQHGFKILEMGYGDLEYKKRWCNLIYNYHHHVVYNSRDLIAKMEAHAMYAFVHLKEHLKRRNLNTLFTKLASFFTAKTAKISATEQMIFESQVATISNGSNQKKPIDIESDAFAFLRKPVYDFQYLQLEPSQNIHVFQMVGKSNTFLVQGTKSEMILTVKNNLHTES